MTAKPTIQSNLSSLIGTMPHMIWRANEMAIYKTSTISSGFQELDAELPNRGWPCSALIELLLSQAGIGEMQLLKPALTTIAMSQRIALIQPPHIPNGLTWQNWSLPAERLIWIKTNTSADALWSAEQILKSGSCGSVLLWQMNIRAESLRRLHLAAQTTNTCFFLMRPASAKKDASPSPLRLLLRPAQGSICVKVIKRQGPHSDTLHLIRLPDMPVGPRINNMEHHHAHMDLFASTTSAAGSHTSLLV